MDEEIQDEEGMSLLSIASYRGHNEVVTCLLDEGHSTMAMMEHDQDGSVRLGAPKEYFLL